MFLAPMSAVGAPGRNGQAPGDDIKQAALIEERDDARLWADGMEGALARSEARAVELERKCEKLQEHLTNSQNNAVIANGRIRDLDLALAGTEARSTGLSAQIDGLNNKLAATVRERDRAVAMLETVKRERDEAFEKWGRSQRRKDARERGEEPVKKSTSGPKMGTVAQSEGANAQAEVVGVAIEGILGKLGIRGVGADALKGIVSKAIAGGMAPKDPPAAAPGGEAIPETPRPTAPAQPGGFRLLKGCRVSSSRTRGPSVFLRDMLAALARKAIEEGAGEEFFRDKGAAYERLALDLVKSGLIRRGVTVLVDAADQDLGRAAEVIGLWADEVVEA